MNLLRKTLVSILLGSSLLFPQITVKASMGLDMIAIPSLQDYLNNNYAPADKKLDRFETAVEFGGEIAYHLSGLDIGVDFRALINSYSFDLGNRYTMEYAGLFPSLCVYRRFEGEGYHFRIGAGAGPRFLSAAETLPFTNQAAEYSSTGYGLLLRADGATGLSQNMYAYIGADIEYCRIPAPESGPKVLKENFSGKEVDFNYFLAGFKLGILFSF